MKTHLLKKLKTTKGLAAWYDRKYASMGCGWDCPRSEALKYIEFMELPQDKNKRLLDVGCGQGHFTAIANEFVESFGIDISQFIINKAKETYPAVQFALGNIEEEIIPEIHNVVDYVASIGSIEHCVDVPQALRSIHTILKADGSFYALVPNEEWIHMDQVNEVTHTDEEWRALFTDAGFIETKYMRINDISHFLLKKGNAS